MNVENSKLFQSITNPKRKKIGRPSKPTDQVYEMLDLLSDGDWHYALELAAITPKFSSVIFHLRKKGYNIISHRPRKMTAKGLAKTSGFWYYRLIKE